MNFFKLYIGDYQRDTAHLSVAQHGAFALMLQHYYATEKPLPVGKALHRMLRAQDKTERDAIDSVAAEFWTVTDDGLINARADEEIKKAGAQADTNRGIAKAREAAKKAARKEHDSCTNRSTIDQPNHSHSQTTDKNLSAGKGLSSPPTAEPAPVFGKDPNTEGHEPTPAGLVCRAIKTAGIADVNPGHPELLRLVAAGCIPLQTWTETARELVGKGKGKFALLLATVAGRWNDAQAAPAVAAAAALLPGVSAVAQTASLLAQQAEAGKRANSPEAKAARLKVMSRFRGGNA